MSRLTPKEREKGWANKVPVGLAIEKLAHYEDLEEAGRLIVLPCKVGSNVYAVGADGEVIAFTVDTINYALSIAHQIGKGFYLTKAEAEAKLAELKRGGGDEKN